MTQAHHIRYIQRRDIDLVKWDACISRSMNQLIYGRSFYLDHMTAGGWDALITGDYEMIMPLTWKKKWGIRYLFQPPFTQQTGIFSPSPLTAATIEAFLQTATASFSLTEIFMNFGNPHPSFTPATNLILHLHPPYEEIYARYKKDLVKNLRLAARCSFQYLTDPDLSMALDLYRRLYQDRTPHVRADAYNRFEKLCFHLREKGQIMLRGVADSRGQILATALLLKDGQRLYLLQSATTMAGRHTEANPFLLDAIIRELSGTPLTLDFEGSDIPGIAHFYRNFGTEDQPYFFFKENRLPWPLRLLKQ